MLDDAQYTPANLSHFAYLIGRTVWELGNQLEERGGTIDGGIVFFADREIAERAAEWLEAQYVMKKLVGEP